MKILKKENAYNLFPEKILVKKLKNKFYFI